MLPSGKLSCYAATAKPYLSCLVLGIKVNNIIICSYPYGYIIPAKAPFKWLSEPVALYL